MTPEAIPINYISYVDVTYIPHCAYVYREISPTYMYMIVLYNPI